MRLVAVQGKVFKPEVEEGADLRVEPEHGPGPRLAGELQAGLV
jgi:hypothetical protein